MTSGMWVDLAELERFIDQLQRFDTGLADSVSKLSSHFAQLGSVWRDAKYQEFAEQWEEAVAAIRGYLDASPEHIHFLRRKADAVAEYLQ